MCLTVPFEWSFGLVARFKKIALITGILLGMSPSPLDGASVRSGMSSKNAIETAVYAVRRAGGGPGEMGQAAGGAARELIERLAVEIERIGRKISGLYAIGSSVPQSLLDEIDDKRFQAAGFIGEMINSAGVVARRAGANPSGEGQAIGAALREMPDSLQRILYVPFEGRIKSYLDARRGRLSPREKGLLTGTAMLVYDRDWEYVASVAGRSVFESGGSRADMESVIMTIFKDYKF
jgi:hypothetical protein